MNKDNNQNNTYKKGYTAEIKALSYLIKKGYLFIARRYQTTFGEIDLIMKDINNTYIFVEVKYRKNINFLFSSLTKKQQQRIKNASLTFIQKENIKNPYMRFDALFLTKADDRYLIHHLKNIIF